MTSWMELQAPLLPVEQRSQGPPPTVTTFVTSHYQNMPPRSAALQARSNNPSHPSIHPPIRTYIHRRPSSPGCISYRRAVFRLRSSTTASKRNPRIDRNRSANARTPDAMSELRPLRGGCQCGRNRYIIAVPQDGVGEAQVLFNTEPVHRTCDFTFAQTRDGRGTAC